MNIVNTLVDPTDRFEGRTTKDNVDEKRFQDIMSVITKHNKHRTQDNTGPNFVNKTGSGGATDTLNSEFMLVHFSKFLLI